MLDAGLLDDVMARADSGQLALIGRGGFLPEMIKAMLERGLAAEPTGHLGMSATTLPGGAARTRATAPPSCVTTGADARS
jgi:putative transposase